MNNMGLLSEKKVFKRAAYGCINSCICKYLYFL